MSVGKLVQLFAARRELESIADEWRRPFGLSATTIGSDGRTHVHAVTERLDTSAGVQWICLTTKNPSMKGVHQLLDFVQTNDEGDLIAFTLGAQTDKTLQQSSLEFFSDGFGPAPKLQRRLSKLLRRGMWVVNPEQNVKEFYRLMTYTDGARELHESGAELLLTDVKGNRAFPGPDQSHPMLLAAKLNVRG